MHTGGEGVLPPLMRGQAWHPPRQLSSRSLSKLPLSPASPGWSNCHVTPSPMWDLSPPYRSTPQRGIELTEMRGVCAPEGKFSNMSPPLVRIEPTAVTDKRPHCWMRDSPSCRNRIALWSACNNTYKHVNILMSLARVKQLQTTHWHSYCLKRQPCSALKGCFISTRWSDYWVI